MFFSLTTFFKRETKFYFSKISIPQLTLHEPMILYINEFSEFR